ncbi:MAG: HlyD family secretion protein [Gammaproteobacteria bacterium]
MPIRDLRPSLPAVAAVVFAIAALLVWRSQPDTLKAEPLHPPPAAAFATGIAAVGLVEPASENVALGTAVPGLVRAVHVRTGEDVSAGQPIFTLDDRDLRALLAVRMQELQAARAGLARLERMPRPEDLPPLRARVREAEHALADARVQQALIEGVDDPRAIRQEDLLRRRIATDTAESRLAAARAELARLAAGAWQPDLEVARANVALAEMQVARVRTDIERLTVTAPRAGRILKLDVRPGEYAQAGASAAPLVVFGDVGALHVRADVDEHEARRVSERAAAFASPRTDGAERIALHFVRVEPYVVPKRQLTGDVAERVDTRVLQVIYRIRATDARVFVGQQVDVYIERPPEAGAPVVDRGVRNGNAGT